MKLAEALILRADLQTRLEQLRERLVLNARVQEGEEPAEDPLELMRELDKLSGQLEALVTRINLTNAAPRADGETLTARLARRECLKIRLSLLKSLLREASSTVTRSTRTELKVVSTVPVRAIREHVDALSKELRILDTGIQAANWATELQ